MKKTSNIKYFKKRVVIFNSNKTSKKLLPKQRDSLGNCTVPEIPSFLNWNTSYFLTTFMLMVFMTSLATFLFAVISLFIFGFPCKNFRLVTTFRRDLVVFFFLKITLK